MLWLLCKYCCGSFERLYCWLIVLFYLLLFACAYFVALVVSAVSMSCLVVGFLMWFGLL